MEPHARPDPRMLPRFPLRAAPGPDGYYDWQAMILEGFHFLWRPTFKSDRYWIVAEKDITTVAPLCIDTVTGRPFAWADIGCAPRRHVALGVALLVVGFGAAVLVGHAIS